MKKERKKEREKQKYREGRKKRGVVVGYAGNKSEFHMRYIPTPGIGVRYSLLGGQGMGMFKCLITLISPHHGCFQSALSGLGGMGEVDRSLCVSF